MNETDCTSGLLNYILANCLFAYDELCKINTKLGEETNADINYLGAMNRVMQDYLIVRVGGLFDTAEHKAKGGIDEVLSFEKIFSNNQVFQKIKEQEIIKYIIKQRHNFVAHTNINHVENDFPNTAKICNSNLREQLENLQNLLKV